MVFTANDLLGWTDFPKGLRVLLLDEDSSSASEIRSKLEEMDYVVSTFCNANEAMTAISNKPESFHVAIVESLNLKAASLQNHVLSKGQSLCNVSTGNSSGRFKFLEVAKDLPTIMTSNMQCLATMMKCIALGAVEFLLKPLSDDKLRNIWQHAAHKAFNAGDKDLSVSLKPVKESVVSMLHLQLGNEEAKSSISVKTENEIRLEENDQEHSEGSDKYPAPPTPQLKQGVRLVDDGDCHDQTNFSLEKEGGDQEGESKSVDLTSCDLSAEISVQECHTQVSRETVNKGEDEATGGFKSEGHMSSGPQNKHGPSDSGGGDAGNLFNAPGIRNLNGNKANRKKTKVDWTPELHKKFVQAVEKLGVDQAIPSRILDLMNVDGLTRHNIASHLQKYRMQRRHILPKEDDRRWPNPRVASQRIYYPQNPAIAFPPYYSNHTVPGGQVYPAWGYTGSYPSGVQMWRPAFYPPWQATEGWHWDPYPGVHADAWGCPVVPPSHHSPCGPHLPFTQYTNGFHNANRTHGSYGMPHSSYDLHPAEEVVDKVVKEAISKPWLPLPIGLNPPSTDSVLTELSKQGISTVPPY